MSALGRNVTTDTLEKHLQRFGAAVTQITEDGQRLSACFGVLDQSYTLAIDLAREAGLLGFSVSDLLHATLDDTPADRVHGLLLALAVLNHRIPLGSLGYDPVAGEVVLRYTMPVSGDLAYEDFEQVLGVLRQVLIERASDLRAVIAGERTAREILR